MYNIQTCAFCTWIKSILFYSTVNLTKKPTFHFPSTEKSPFFPEGCGAKFSLGGGLYQHHQDGHGCFTNGPLGKPWGAWRWDSQNLVGKPGGNLDPADEMSESPVISVIVVTDSDPIPGIYHLGKGKTYNFEDCWDETRSNETVGSSFPRGPKHAHINFSTFWTTSPMPDVWIGGIRDDEGTEDNFAPPSTPLVTSH